MTLGPIGLHGGGELVRGDEPFLRAVLEAAGEPARSRAASCAPGAVDTDDADVRRVVILPTAAGGERPEMAVGHAVDAFTRAAAGLGVRVRVMGAMVVDAHSAADPRWAGTIAGADLVYLPGGDPRRVTDVLGGTLAAQALLAARARGATIAGASAGAMALADRTWTPAGPAAGLGFVAGLVVVPHADRFADDDTRGARAWLGGAATEAVGILALDERTGVLSDRGNGATGLWRVVGPGRARWIAAGAIATVIAREGDRLRLG